MSPALQADSYHLSHQGSPLKGSKLNTFEEMLVSRIWHRMGVWRIGNKQNKQGRKEKKKQKALFLCLSLPTLCGVHPLASPLH